VNTNKMANKKIPLSGFRSTAILILICAGLSAAVFLAYSVYRSSPDWIAQKSAEALTNGDINFLLAETRP
jgi:hypothetical protein